MRWVRASLRGVLAAMTLASATQPASAEFRHGLSTFGELKYPADFKHFEYVNPSAPKGGKIALIGSGGVTSFDTFNAFILKGDAAEGLGLLYDSLMTGSGDEPGAAYGLIAESAELAADKKSVTFKMRPEAKFADGSPITADDVVFTFNILKEKGHPVSFRRRLRDVTGVTAIDPHTVRYDFQGELVRDLPLIVAGLPVLPKAWWATRNFDQSSLEKPLGSGPYEIGSFQPGRFVSYKRRADYWAKDLPVNAGTNNFDEIRYDYFRDRQVGLENLLNGTFDFREEFTAKDWSMSYGVPAVRDGRIQRKVLPDGRPSGAQGFFLNMRRPQFSNPLVRQALGQAFDFEWSNRFLFFGLYTRTESFFENSELKAVGPPSPGELALLEPYRDRLPPEVFGEPFVPAKSNGLGYNAEPLRQASKLLEQAGWTYRDNDGGCSFFCRFETAMAMRQAAPVRLRQNDKGETLKVEILIFEDTFERVILPYVTNLRNIGVDARMRRVDGAQYQKRLKSFDFDIAIQRYVMGLTPGIEIVNYWGSEAAKQEGSPNLGGIANPVVDALAEKVMAAQSREDLVTAARAIDRVMRSGHYWVPQWYKGSHAIAFWDKFSWPEKKPKYSIGAPATWWYDAEKAARLRSRTPPDEKPVAAAEAASAETKAKD
jgi:microcin C transport system substrate-binding protein